MEKCMDATAVNKYRVEIARFTAFVTEYEPLDQSRAILTLARRRRAGGDQTHERLELLS